MKDCKDKKDSPSFIRKEVKRKVRKEYQDFIDSYKKMPEDRRFQMMIVDADKIRFYRNAYVIIVIIGDFTVEEWKWLYLYYKGIAIIKDFYRSYLAFRKDWEEEHKDKPETAFLASLGLQGRNMNIGAYA